LAVELIELRHGDPSVVFAIEPLHPESLALILRKM
jgi:hypothetical protein